MIEVNITRMGTNHTVLYLIGCCETHYHDISAKNTQPWIYSLGINYQIKLKYIQQNWPVIFKCQVHKNQGKTGKLSILKETKEHESKWKSVILQWILLLKGPHWMESEIRWQLCIKVIFLILMVPLWLCRRMNVLVCWEHVPHGFGFFLIYDLCI